MKISVITVCYNEGENINFTLDSIIEQTSTEFEMIICDGGSSDDTFNRVLEYKEKFETKGINFVAQSKKDNGIYYGMNKAIGLVSSEYCIFMNIGDRFHDNRVIEDAISRLSVSQNIDVLYGDLLRFDDKMKAYVRSNHKTLSRINEICHQVAFIRTNILKKRPYNTEYKLAADYEYWLYLKSNNGKFVHFSRIVADYRIGGRSEINIKNCYEENEKIRDYYWKKNAGLVKEKNRRFLYFYGKWGGSNNQEKGWSQEEECATWAIGNKTDFYFTVRKKYIQQHEILIYILQGYGYLNFLYVNGNCLGPISGKNYRILIPKELLQYGTNHFSIITDNKVLRRMDIEGKTPDPRPCNVYISEIGLVPYLGKMPSKIISFLFFGYWKIRNAVVRRVYNISQVLTQQMMAIKDNMIKSSRNIWG